MQCGRGRKRLTPPSAVAARALASARALRARLPRALPLHALTSSPPLRRRVLASSSPLLSSAEGGLGLGARLVPELKAFGDDETFESVTRHLLLCEPALLHARRDALTYFASLSPKGAAKSEALFSQWQLHPEGSKRGSFEYKATAPAARVVAKVLDVACAVSSPPPSAPRTVCGGMEDPRSDAYDAEFARETLPCAQWVWAPAASWSEVGLIEWAWYRDLVFLVKLALENLSAWASANNGARPLFAVGWNPEGVTPTWVLRELEPGKGTVAVELSGLRKARSDEPVIFGFGHAGAHWSLERAGLKKVSFLLFTVTFYANLAHNLTRSP
jgi:hypothetical protein